MTNTEIKTGIVTRVWYRSIGNMLTTDILRVEYKVEGRKYHQDIPNSGWGYQNPSLQFFGLTGIKPTDIDGSEYIFDGEKQIEVVWKPEEEECCGLAKRNFQQGVEKLQEAEWFNPQGKVWDSGEQKAFGGMSVEPGTGNKAGVPVEGDGDGS